jgi:pyruvate carboxylase
VCVCVCVFSRVWMRSLTLLASRFPKVFREYRITRKKFGNLAVLPTHIFVNGLTQGREVGITLSRLLCG